MTMHRARPLLGTLVDIRVEDVDAAQARLAIDAAFDEIAAVHRLMCFHADDSDLARVNRDASRRAVAVDARTREVIVLALEFARASDGRFDPTVAAELVAANLLPHPRDAPLPDPQASWRDIEVSDDGIRCARPLWIDLGGIAKGYAVDRAIERLRECGIARACVNAGGDLRRIGSGTESVHIRTRGRGPSIVRALELGEGSVATSGGSVVSGCSVGSHVNGVGRYPLPADVVVTVVAERCVIADALTKIVMCDAEAAAPVLDAYDAMACVHRPPLDWQLLGRAA